MPSEHVMERTEERSDEDGVREGVMCDESRKMLPRMCALQL